MEEQKLFDCMIEENTINNIWWVPILEISAMKCSEGRDLIGRRETKFLVEGDTLAQAIINATSYPGYVDNYRNLTEEQRRRITPFKLDLEKRAERVLFCSHRFKNRTEDYTCGIPVHDIKRHEDQHDKSVNINGEYGMCCIMGYDVPDFSDCPYKKRTYGMNSEIG
jgi:hypothetical protein